MKQFLRKFAKSLQEGCRGFFTRNLGLKIVAVIFAVLMWAYVLVAMNPERTKAIDGVTISLEGYTDLLSRNLILVDSDLGEASVTVSAPITNHADLNASRVNCRASLSTITAAGTYRLMLSTTVQSNLGTVASVSPASVTVEVDNLISKTVPVRLNYTGTLPEGYEIIAETYEQSFTIEGAARYIEPVVRAVAQVDLTDRTESMEAAVNLIFFDSQGNELTVITRSQDAPNITVRLTLSAVKQVEVRENVSLAEDTYFDLTTEASPSTVTVYGDKATLDTVDHVSTESLVLPAQEDILTRDLALVLPQGVTLKKGQPETVTVTCTVTEKQGEKELEVPITYLHRPAGLNLGENAPTFVTVTVTGKMRLLEQLTADDLSAQVDLANLSAGTRELVAVILAPDQNRFPGLTVTPTETRIQVELAQDN